MQNVEEATNRMSNSSPKPQINKILSSRARTRKASTSTSNSSARHCVLQAPIPLSSLREESFNNPNSRAFSMDQKHEMQIQIVFDKVDESILVGLSLPPLDSSPSGHARDSLTPSRKRRPRTILIDQGTAKNYPH